MKLRNAIDRRSKLRFAINRELRYTLLENDKIIATGRSETIDMSSGGIAFRTATNPKAMIPQKGQYIELSIGWPALLDDSCPMRLVVYGRVARCSDSAVACTVEKWEFRTGSGQVAQVIPMRPDSRLMRWVEYRREVMLKTAPASALA
jgi:PilZ domain